MRIKSYLDNFFSNDLIPTALPEYAQLIQIKEEILRLMIDADKIAEVIRMKMKEELTSH